MAANTLKYLLLEHLSILRDGFHLGLKNMAIQHPDLILKGIEISDINADKPTLNQLIANNSFHFIWMNLDFPIPLHEKHHTPISLLSSLKNSYPEAHIIAITGNTKVYFLRKIFQKENPHCILELVDCDQQTIVNALNVTLKKDVYYSPTIMKLLHNFLKTFDAMDQADYSILHELSLGTPVTALPEKVFLSHSTILSRRTKLKELFKVYGKSDTELIREVKMQGYV